MKRVLAIAIVLEILKWLLLIAAAFLPETDNEFLNAMLAITMWVLLLPAMLVSYEQGTHGILARIVMFCAGTAANVMLISIAVSLWRSRKGKVAQAIPEA
ncbi:MAG TPA: hypothetical protein VEZ40_16365 [Pyrinomonadaceae bacterium]|jgi:hypothetical protein|nr:hypothetical protein [Pyrinomonadaceae bacterium]